MAKNTKEMKPYIALLRGLNVGGRGIIKMIDLKLLFESLDFVGVTTYIQSGNVIFSSEREKNLGQLISGEIEKLYGFKVPVLVKEISEMEVIFDACPFPEEKKESSFFTFLDSNPSEKLLEESRALSFPDEEFFITDNCIYFFSEKGYNKVKGNNNFFEKKLKVSATTRNYNTVAKLLELSK